MGSFVEQLAGFGEAIRLDEMFELSVEIVDSHRRESTEISHELMTTMGSEEQDP